MEGEKNVDQGGGSNVLFFLIKLRLKITCTCNNGKNISVLVPFFRNISVNDLIIDQYSLQYGIYYIRPVTIN
jgi:cadmium resistance protein CadD (predicted permease)